MRISINLASHPFNDLGPILRKLRIAMGAMAALSLLLWYGLHLVHNAAERARERDHSLDGQLAKLNAEQQSYQALMRLPANAAVLTQAQTLNQLFDEKSFSWTLAMEDLETVLPGGVQVTTLEPKREKDGHFSIHLHVMGPRDHAVDLVRNLERSKRFLLARIVGENSETNNGPGQRVEVVSPSSPVNFDILAEYNPPSAEERKKLAARRQEKVDEAAVAAPPAPPQPIATPRPFNQPAAQYHPSAPAQYPTPMPMPNPAQYPAQNPALNHGGPQNTPPWMNRQMNQGPNHYPPNQPQPNQMQPNQGWQR